MDAGDEGALRVLVGDLAESRNRETWGSTSQHQTSVLR